MHFLREAVLIFNYLVTFYFLAVNTIYLTQLALSAVGLSKYIKKLLFSDYRRYMSSSNMLPVSILVPAYNEEETIVENVTSLLSLEYPLYEVVVVNDGSKDATLERLIAAFELKEVSEPFRNRLQTKPVRKVYRNPELPNLVVIDKENGEKADALNAAINASSYPIIVAVDADSLLESESLVRVIMPFIEDRLTVATRGIVRVANGCIIRDGRVKEVRMPRSPLACLQVVEYLRAFLTGRIGWDALGSLLIVSGAFGAFDKEVVIQAGGYDKTVGEDMELVVRIHRRMRENKRDYRIRFVPDPVCWTQVPENLGDLRTQRQRWHVGLMDSLFKHKKMLFNPRYGVIGLYAIPYFWLIEMLGPVIEVTGYVFVPLAYILGILHTRFFLLFLAASLVYGFILSFGAVLLDESTFNRYKGTKDFLRLVFYSVVENFGFRQLVTLFKVAGMLQYGRLKSRWGIIKRSSFNNSRVYANKQRIDI